MEYVKNCTIIIILLKQNDIQAQRTSNISESSSIDHDMNIISKILSHVVFINFSRFSLAKCLIISIEEYRKLFKNRFSTTNQFK